MTDCHYFKSGLCRSCSSLALPASTRDTHKEAALSELVARELGAGYRTAPLWKPSAAFGSRGKAKLSVSGDLAHPVIGLLGPEQHGFEGTELLDCPLHFPVLNQILHWVKEAISRHGLTPYDVKTRQGELKGLILKSNEDGTEVMLRFILRSRGLLEKVRVAAEEIQAAHPFVKVVSVNLQPVPHAIIEGEQEILLTEQSHLWEKFDGFSLAFAPQSFSQVTHETAQALYGHLTKRLAAEPAREGGMLDLFCGVGGFSFAASPFVKWTHGVELSTQAIACAKLGCERNVTQNARFEAADVETFLQNYRGQSPEVVLINPPRRGVSAAGLQAIISLKPTRIFYSSCNPVTLMRDLRLLMASYEVEALTPFDMFPLTEHIEVVAELHLFHDQRIKTK